MTKIQITPKYADVKPREYYVYIHRRITDNVEFYVGKGYERRAWDKTQSDNRSPKWVNVARKHGVRIDIVQDSMSEDDAFLLEMWLIAKLRHEGINLANHTDGGDGVSGYKWRYEDRKKKFKPVECSNGMYFENQAQAVEWLIQQGHHGACSESVSACVRGKNASAYGYTFWPAGSDPVEFTDRGSNISKAKCKRIYCSNGMEFASLRDAAAWACGPDRISAGSPKISVAARTPGKKAYGYTWKYI